MIASMPTASIAADNTASWAALSAMSTSAGQNPEIDNSQGIPSGAAFFNGAFLPFGVIIAAGVLAIVLATEHGRRGGAGFPPRPVSVS
ncbi:MAG: hypothetical protein LC656_02315 [Sphingomonadales bacterium]|nr:hypothetical protein [Sphingomonadales bacterium]